MWAIRPMWMISGGTVHAPQKSAVVRRGRQQHILPTLLPTQPRRREAGIYRYPTSLLYCSVAHVHHRFSLQSVSITSTIRSTGPIIWLLSSRLTQNGWWRIYSSLPIDFVAAIHTVIISRWFSSDGMHKHPQVSQWWWGVQLLEGAWWDWGYKLFFF